MSPKFVGIVGFGRFGKILYGLLKDDFAVRIYDSKEKGGKLEKNIKIVGDLKEIYESDAVFFAVPISVFEEVLSKHKKYFRDGQVLIDVLSVKMHPAKIFKKYLKNTKTQAILTHPMFGPDSSKNGFKDLPMVVNKFTANKETYNFWRNYFEKKGLKVIDMSPRIHDKLAASSQGLTHFIGRLLNFYGLKKTPIDSVGTKKLLEVVEQTCNDSPQLFTDLQHFNPYTAKMRIKLGASYDSLYNRLLPKQVNLSYITFGIQGGKGSFNEEALEYYVKKEKIKKYKVKYLFTSENVLKALHEGIIDRGQFAIHNSVGGIVGESIEAMAKYKFNIIEEFVIKIAHALMVRKGSPISAIDTIMSHPQVFAQCKDTLAKKYADLKKVSGEKELMDHAVVAKQLAEGKLPKNIAVMGSKVLAGIYDLDIIEDNLQDAKENYTSFLQVARA